MKKKSETIIFFGSGPVAAKSLELLQETFIIEAAITKPQPSHHKEVFPVIKVADKHGIPLITAKNRPELDLIFQQGTTFKSTVAVLIDYGIIISEKVIGAFPMGIINSHFSILPEWRGADPITFSILSGQKTSGVSLMLLVAKMDEGPILAQASYALPKDITTPLLTDKLIHVSQELLERNLEAYLHGKLQARAQSNERVSYSRKLTKDDGNLDWQKKPAKELEREIRAFIEWPKSRTTIANKEVIITKAHVEDTVNQPTKGKRPFKTYNNLIGLPTIKDVLVIDRLKPIGKNEMSAQAFLAGYGI